MRRAEKSNSNLDRQTLMDFFRDIKSVESHLSLPSEKRLTFTFFVDKLKSREFTMSENFNLDLIDKTFTSYKKGQMFDGVVVVKRPDGAIFNIGGKNDAFLPADDLDDYAGLKIGDRFKVVITNQKNDEGMIEVSKRQADDKVLATQNAQKLKLGSAFSFVVTHADKEGLYSKMGDYDIFVPIDEVFSHEVRDPRRLEGKQFEATVTEISRDDKRIIASIKMLAEQVKKTNETLFWSSIFINKIVKGKVKKILPYGAFVDVDGVDCFLHISNIAHRRLNSPDEVIKEGETYTFKVIELDRDNKKVALSLKALSDSPRTLAIRELEIGQVYKGKVVKLLAFGAIIELENGASGLLHISNATEDCQKQIYEIVKLGDEVSVRVLDKNEQDNKVSFKLA